MLDKYGDSETYVFTRDGSLMMRLPGSHEEKPYDGRFGILPSDFNEGYFPVKE